MLVGVGCSAVASVVQSPVSHASTVSLYFSQYFLTAAMLILYLLLLKHFDCMVRLKSLKHSTLCKFDLVIMVGAQNVLWECP